MPPFVHTAAPFVRTSLLFAHTCVWRAVLLNYRIKNNLLQISRLQDKFIRNGKLVDAEIRAAFPRPPPTSVLTADQRTLLESCQLLETQDYGEWKHLPSPDPFLTMHMKHTRPVKGERCVAYGRASAVIDCPPGEALAWWFDQGSRESMRTWYEQNHPARLRPSKVTPHDVVTANVHRMPFPLYPREFVNRQLCTVDDNGDFLTMASPVDAVIDYGTSIRTVRGTAKGFMRLAKLNNDQCTVTYFQYLDGGGSIPEWVVNRKVAMVLGYTSNLRDCFQRDDEIDTAERNELVEIAKNVPQVYSAEENEIVDRTMSMLGALKPEEFRPLESPDHLVEMGLSLAETGEIRGLVMRASTILDAPVEYCVACDYLLLRSVFKNGSYYIERRGLEINAHHSLWYQLYDLGNPSLQVRQFVSNCMWKRLDEKTMVALTEPTESDEFPRIAGAVRALATSLLVYEMLEPVNGVPQTKFTSLYQIDLKGVLPRFAVEASAVNFLSVASLQRKSLDRGVEIDGATRARNVEMIKAHAEPYSAEESHILEKGEEHFAIFDDVKTRHLKMRSPLTKAQIAFATGDRFAWGWASTTVQASPEEVMAHMWDPLRRSTWKALDLEKAVDEKVNDHNLL